MLEPQVNGKQAERITSTERDNGNVHRAAAKIIVSKSRAARGFVCNVLLFGVACKFIVCDA